MKKEKMNKTTEALKLAEEALEELHYSSGTVKAVTLYKSALAAISEALEEQDHIAASGKVIAEPLQILPGGGAFPFVEVGYVGEFVAPTKSLPAGTPLCVAPIQPVKQEPVAIVVEVDRHGDATVVSGAWQLDGGTHTFYAAPVSAKREWVDLTCEEVTALIREGAADGGWQGFAIRLQTAFKEKNK